MKQFLRFIIFLLLLPGALQTPRAQSQQPDDSYNPLLLPLSENNEKYLRFILWNQFWLTSHNLESDQNKLQVTPSIRRMRVLAYAQCSPRFLILTHFGLNSLNPQNLTATGTESNAPQFFLHGAWGEFKVSDHLFLGGGLHYWKGLTRLSSASTLNFMTLDQSRPFTSWHSLGITDQFARHLGMYAKGEFGRLDYRLAVNSPLRNNIGAGIDYGLKDSNLTYNGVLHEDAANNPAGNTIVEGYVRYNFWDKESTKLPYMTGTYLGSKKVFALGAGFYAHPNGMYSEATQTHRHVRHFAADAYLDMPIDDFAVLHAYASAIRFDYGKNYVSRWAGTGTTLYGQVGYYLRSFRMMPYIAMQNGDYEGFEKPVRTLDVGLNYFLNGHHAKLTLEYHRIQGDIREAAIDSQDDAFAQLRFQFHVFL